MGHKFKIAATMQGHGTQLYLDGIPIKGVISYSLTGSAKEPTRLTLELFTDGVEVEGEVEDVVSAGNPRMNSGYGARPTNP